MPIITTMDLPMLPIESPEFHRDPMPFVATARRHHPWLAQFNAGYVVHGYQAVKDLAMRDDVLEMGLGGVVEFYHAQGTPWARFMEEMMQSRRDGEHLRLRASVAAAFTPRRANEARPLMRKVIADLLAQWVPRGGFDFAEFASYFPVSVLCGVLGVPTQSIARVRDAIEAHMASLALEPALKPTFMAAFDTLWNFADTMILEREATAAHQNQGLLDALIAAKNAGRMSDTELRHMLLVLLIAGYDTSKNMLTLIVYQLLDRPDDWARCAQDRAFCGRVVEEMLRHSTIATVFRTVREDFSYADHVFPQHTFLAFATPLANRDPAAFPNPMQFDPERVNTNRHLAFGRGAHICLGQFLARVQLEEGLHLIAQRIPHPRLTGEVSWRPFLGAWGLRTLPISLN